MWFRSPVPKQVQQVLDALEKLPRSAKKFGGPDAVSRAFAALVDHTLLKPEATPDDVRRLCEEGVRHGFATVIVNPRYVALAAKSVSGKLPVGSVAGFPLGAARPDVKRMEAELALADGASEIDMVMAVGALKAGDDDYAEEDIHGIAEVCHKHKAILKVILECAVLTGKEKRRAAKLAVRAGADFVKTSTGFGPAGANAEDVALLRSVVGNKVGVKASAGIRALPTALEMLRAGASRIGTSSGVVILTELRRLLDRS
jgi:deoxyribose-phosphate aldolase